MTAMNKVTLNKQSLLRVLLAVYLFPLYLVVFSLSVPPGDLPLCGLMLALAVLGFMLARRQSRAWQLIWLTALGVSVLCGILEVVAGQRIARQRPHQSRAGLQRGKTQAQGKRNSGSSETREMSMLSMVSA
jgi:hypothetical protein